MNVRIEQLNPTIGKIDENVSLIFRALEKAEKDGIDLLILPEMVLTGYPVQDLLENDAFREYCFKMNERIISRTDKTALIFGTLTENSSGTGRKMFNSALLCRNGKKIDQIHKTLLPTYDIFDELRYFEPNKHIKCMELDGIKLGVTICEDIWYNENEVQYHNYDINPAVELKALGARVIINISASPYTKNKHVNRLNMLQNHANGLNLPIFFSNQTGAHTDVVFDGDSLAMNSKGDIVSLSRPFHPGYADVGWNPETGTLEPLDSISNSMITPDKYTRMLGAILLGIRDYFDKSGITRKAVLGLSGGIDSALVATLAAEAIGSKNVVALTMPSEFSSEGSINDSKKLAENLGIELHNLPIGSVFNSCRETLEPLFADTGFGVAEENLQSRARGALLMAYSNKFGHLLLATGNKSELSVGYATLYGDMNGGLNPVGDLYKSEVFQLCEWLNRDYFKREVIPRQIIEKPPSAELRPDQKDTDSLPPYEILDDILWRYIELQQEFDSIVSEGLHENSTVRKILKLVDINEFKRFQAPPIIKLSSKSFGSGRRWPVVQGWSSQNR